MSGPSWNQRDSSPPEQGARPRPLVDSGLFWLLVFGIMAAGGYLAVSPKYEQRQEGIQTKFEGRRQAWLNRIDGEIEPAETSQSGNGRLWLAVIVVLSVLLVLGGGSWLLLRSSFTSPQNPRRDDQQPEDGRGTDASSRQPLGQNP